MIKHIVLAALTWPALPEVRMGVDMLFAGGLLSQEYRDDIHISF